MSRYSDYEKKIAPWVKAKNFVVRHRVLLLCLAAASACAAVVLTSTKGVVKEETVISDHITYGQILSYSASAFMGDVSYEFSPAEEESWTSVVPNAVGSYKMRAKSSNSFGGDYYGDVHYFTIDPMEISCSLASTEYAYGSKPGLSIELSGSDKVASYEIVYDDISKEKPTASITNLKIENEAGGDATNNYKITFVDSEVSLGKGSLELTFDTKTYVYDGNEHSLEEEPYTLKGELASGDEIVFEMNSIISVGSISSAKEGSIKVMHDGSFDVTKHYDIKTSYGSLTVSKAPLSISSASYTKVYDGQPVSKVDYESATESGLQGGDEVKIVYEDQSKNVAPGTYENKFSYSFTSGSEDNYDVTSKAGSLTINKRPLNVKISGTHAYEGLKFAGVIPDDEIAYLDSTSLVSGHVATFCVEESEEENCLINRANVSVKIADAEGQDVTDYYDIDLDSAYLHYEKRDITIKAKTLDFTYDGEAHKGEYEYDVENLASGDEIRYAERLDSEPDFVKELDEGSKIKTIKYTPKIKGIFHGEEDRTKYYNISLVEGTLTLSARPLSIRLEVDRSYADYGTEIGKDLANAEYTFIDDTSLVTGHNMTITPSDVYGDPQFKVTIYGETKEDVTHNYSVQLSKDSSFCFTKSQLTLSAFAYASFDYDGEKHSINPTISGLREGDEVVWEEKSSPKDHEEFKAGAYPFELKIAKIIKSSTGEDVSEHYIYESSYMAKMTIKKASPVTATFTFSRDYDGREYQELGLVSGTDYTFEGLKSTDKGVLTLKEDPFLNKATKNFDVEIINTKYNAKVNDCYEDITKINANNITWEKGPLKAEVEDNTVVYNGSYTSTTINVTGLAEYDLVDFTCNKKTYKSYRNSTSSFALEKTDADSYPIDIEITKVYHSSTKNDASAYYSSVEAIDGSVTITKRPLKIKIYEHGSNSDYDVRKNGVCYVTEDGTSLATDQRLTFTYQKSGEDKVEYIPHIYDSSGTETTKNYSITIDGEAIFDRIPLTISYSDTSIVYDGEYHYGEASVTNAPGNCTMAKATIGLKTNPKDQKIRFAGESVTNTPEVVSIKDSEGIDETALYDVTCLPGTLTITERPIHILINGSRTYNGSLFSSASLETGEYKILNQGTDSGLVYSVGDELVITPIDDGTGSIIGAADADDFDVRIMNGNEDRTQNYDISLDVNYTFEKADVEFGSDEYVYDGKAHKGRAVAHGMGNGETQDVPSATSEGKEQTEAGTYTYTITVASVSTYDGKDRSAYYNLPASNEATLTILKADATIRFNNLSNKYVLSTRANGSPKDLNEEFSKNSSEICMSGLPEGFRAIDYVFKEGPTEPGTYNFSDYVLSYKIVNDLGEDKTANFNVAVKGELIIKISSTLISSSET